jgi:formylglycine-generating enzyme required for sulfatase activity
MIGNVAEFCSDAYGPVDRGHVLWSDRSDPPIAVRGGAWATYKEAVRCAARRYLGKGQPGFDVGFRVVLEIEKR